MNTFDTDNHIERRNIAIILISTGVICILLFAAVLLPMRARKNSYLNEIVRLDAELEPYLSQVSEESLQLQLDREAARFRYYADKWKELTALVSTFRGVKATTDLFSPSKEGRIDFKIAFFEARERLTKKAEENKVSLPADLGIGETIAATENAEIQLWRLAAVSRLLDAVIESGIKNVIEIRPLEPRIYPLNAPEYSAMHEYPMLIRFRCRYPQVMNLIRRSQQPGSFFALRHIHGERKESLTSDALEIEAVYGAAIFKGPVDDILLDQTGRDENRYLFEGVNGTGMNE